MLYYSKILNKLYNQVFLSCLQKAWLASVLFRDFAEISSQLSNMSDAKKII